MTASTMIQNRMRCRCWVQLPGRGGKGLSLDFEDGGKSNSVAGDAV